MNRNLTNTLAFSALTLFGIANAVNAQTYVFDKYIGNRGNGFGQFYNPFGLNVDANDNLYATDVTNNSVSEFGSNGKFTRYIGSPGNGKGQWNNPKDVAFDTKGNIAFLIGVASVGFSVLRKRRLSPSAHKLLLRS